MNQFLKVAVIAVWIGVIAQAAAELSLQQLHEQHRRFELREAIAGKLVKRW